MSNVENNQSNGTSESSNPAGAPPATAVRSALAKPAITFVSQDSDQGLIVAGGRILAAMTANAAYPNPMPSLAVLSAARDGFIAAVNANDRGKLAIAARDKARAPFEAALRELSMYVAQHCKGDLVTLLSSGYPAQRQRGAIAQIAPPTPGNLRVRPGPSSGQLVGRCERTPGAALFQWRYATAAAPTAFTVTDTSSKARVTLEGLVPGTQYLVQVRACGNRGSSDWSDAVVMYAV
ncbi:MAG TPA: fibronectin type III domain-containing protein [Xanthomonadaceae bacterium]|nr:fibronectin type III domain-containing protein [Xanthomonadaceae bacterium]